MLTAPDFKEKKILFVFSSRGDKFSFKNDNILITSSKHVIHQSSCYKLFSLIIVGHATITSGLLQRAKKFGFSIFLLSHGLRPYGSWLSAAEGNILLRQVQYNYNQTEIAKYLVTDKINGQINNLKKIRKKSDKLKSVISSLKNYRNDLSGTHELKEILGIEGVSSRIYFPQIFDCADWNGRKPRTKCDPTNTLLDIGYTLLFCLIESMLSLYGFDIYKGVYHQTFYQRKSLVCDLVEPFRGIIDWRIRKAYMLEQINIDDFTIDQNSYRLYGDKAKPYVAFLLEELIKNKDEIFNYIQLYYRAFIREKTISEFPIFNEE